MCGIAGYIGKQVIEENILERTLSLMGKRGPDARSYTKNSVKDCHIYLLHSRLSIIDLDKRANQPLTIGDNTIVYNGEIYNYLELREELVKKGIRLSTSSDTEVLMHYYALYGENCVDYFEGMWSFAIYDSRKQNLFLSRDRFAEKPFYYLETSDGFYFGSEIKAVRSLCNKRLTVNDNQVLRYLTNGYKSLYKNDETFFNEISEVPYASNLIIGPELEKKITRYWFPRYMPVPMSSEDAIEGIKHHLTESLKIRLRSDVPIAFCLSGGIDSSSLASIAAKIFNLNIHTFSIIDNDERYNEYENIQHTIKDINCKNTIIHVSHENTLERLTDLIEYHDVPLATITFFVHSFITEAVARNGYKVIFSGHAADELFTGYYDHFNLYLYEMRNHPRYREFLSDWHKNIGTIVRNPYLKNPELYFSDPNNRKHIYLNNEEFRSILKIPFYEEFYETKYASSSMLRSRMLNELFHEGVRLILHEDDLNAMMFSIENRCPYLDSRLFRFAYSIPTEHMIQKGLGKYLLREAMKGILNDFVRLDKQKKGFNASINSIIDLKSSKNMDYLMEPSRIFDYVDREKLLKLLQGMTDSNSYSKFVFNFLNAKIFLEQN